MAMFIGGVRAKEDLRAPTSTPVLWFLWEGNKVAEEINPEDSAAALLQSKQRGIPALPTSPSDVLPRIIEL